MPSRHSTRAKLRPLPFSSRLVMPPDSRPEFSLHDVPKVVTLAEVFDTAFKATILPLQVERCQLGFER
jgi:hypothetical protein